MNRTETDRMKDALRWIENIIQSDIAYGFPAAQLAVIKDGSLLYSKGFGNVRTYEADGSRVTGSAPVTGQTLFDLASVTKMYSVNYILQYLVSEGKLDIDAKLTDFFGEAFVQGDTEMVRTWKRNLTVHHVLAHEAGFPADPPYYRSDHPLFSGNDHSRRTREKTLESIFRTPLEYEPGTKTVYSDTDFILLGFLAEAVTGKTLDVFLKETFFEPLGLKRITYNPLENGFHKEDCAATELNGNTRDGAVHFENIRTYTLQGEVHDEKAWYAMAGISGHAGLFASAADLAKLAGLMPGGSYEGHRFFKQDVIEQFTAPKDADHPGWGLGWQRYTEAEHSWLGGFASPGAYGHTGWTGTLALTDPVKNLVIVYLTNSIHAPVTDKEKDPNTFDAEYFLSARRSFVPKILYAGMSDIGSFQESVTDLLKEILEKKKREMRGIRDPDHPGYRAIASIQNVLQSDNER